MDASGEEEVAMDQQAERVWLAYVEAERAYREAMAELRHVDMVPVLREGLRSLPWRRAALAVLGSSDTRLSEELLPELFQLASVSHSLIGEVRRCVLRIPRERLLVQLEPLIRRLTADPASDYEAYRRSAELLREIGSRPLLDLLVRAAATSADAEIREVADDFGHLGDGGGE
jgi:hypothetical protein